jgi:hypothetical protein
LPVAVDDPVPTLPANAPIADLAARLHALGLPRETAVTVTRNRITMLSWNARRGLRLHAGYAHAPDAVLVAIVRFMGRRAPRVERAAARRIFMAFPAHEFAESRPRPTRRTRRISERDLPIIARLHTAHAQFNVQHFAGALAAAPIYLSDRMRRRLGELRVPRTGEPAEIVMSRRHIHRDGWSAALETLLHEMVHQWQAETGRPIDHRREFRRMARHVGIHGGAVARIDGVLSS